MPDKLTRDQVVRTVKEKKSLRGAYLSDANLEWSSHDLVAELLRRAASSPQEFAVAGLVLMRRDWCWEDFLDCDIAGKLWAIGVLREWKCPMIPDAAVAKAS